MAAREPTVGSVKRFVVAVLLALFGFALLAPPAGAHAALESTEPQSGAILDEPPESVTLHFTEAIQADDDALRVFDAAARASTTRCRRVDGGRLGGIGVIADGGYVVAWQV